MTTMSFRVRSGSVLPLRRRPCAMGLVMMLFAAWCVLSPPVRAADAQILWQIGQADNNNAEFALGRNVTPSSVTTDSLSWGSPMRSVTGRTCIRGRLMVGREDVRTRSRWSLDSRLRRLQASADCSVTCWTRTAVHRRNCGSPSTDRNSPSHCPVEQATRQYSASLPRVGSIVLRWSFLPASCARRERIDDHHAQRQLVVVRLPVTRDPAGPGNRSGQRHAREFVQSPPVLVDVMGDSGNSCDWEFSISATRSWRVSTCQVANRSR